jgi:hypothetical protein
MKFKNINSDLANPSWQFIAITEDTKKSRSD